ncbi:hypothetical protein ACFQZ8_00900 [Micromonospora azadirachtae]|uniref:Uncharacterized protein n=1 Tax=Micromonospora azadirachtae TaxID=1970735 RepID=A0ABW2ZVY7_9ACTN
MLRCLMHNVEVTGWEIRTSYIFQDGRVARGLDAFLFSCSCEHLGATFSIDDFEGDEVTDGEKVIGLQIVDMAGEPILEWFEQRPVDYW